LGDIPKWFFLGAISNAVADGTGNFIQHGLPVFLKGSHAECFFADEGM